MHIMHLTVDRLEIMLMNLSRNTSCILSGKSISSFSSWEYQVDPIYLFHLFSITACCKNVHSRHIHKCFPLCEPGSNNPTGLCNAFSFFWLLLKKFGGATKRLVWRGWICFLPSHSPPHANKYRGRIWATNFTVHFFSFLLQDPAVVFLTGKWRRSGLHRWDCVVLCCACIVCV